MSLLIDLVNQVASYQAIPPQLLAASTQGSALDMSNQEIATGMIVDIGAITVANVTSLQVQAEECATTNGTWTVIPNMVVTVTATTTAANTHQVVRGLRTYRYARANCVTLAATTTTGAFPINVEIIAQNKFVNPSGDFGGYSNYPSSST